MVKWKQSQLIKKASVPKQKKHYKWTAEEYTWEQVFAERIEERVNLNDIRLRNVESGEDFRTIIENNFLTGDSNNADDFWTNIKTTSGLGDFLSSNKSRNKAIRQIDNGRRVRQGVSFRFYKVEFVNRQGTEVKRYKNLDTGMWTTKPEESKPYNPNEDWY